MSPSFGACFAWFDGGFTLAHRVVLSGLILIVLAVLSRQGWLRFFGPVLFYDMVGIARRSRYLLLRSLYVLLLSGLVFWVYILWIVNDRGRASFSADSRTAAMFAESFFYTFMSVQFVVMVVLTPAYVAGAVADEKDRKTLEFLLA